MMRVLAPVNYHHQANNSNSRMTVEGIMETCPAITARLVPERMIALQVKTTCRKKRICLEKQDGMAL